MNSNPAPREIHIPGVGGPFLETTAGDSVRIELRPDFKSDPTLPSVTWVRPAVLLSMLMLSAGSILGWIGYATLAP